MITPTADATTAPFFLSFSPTNRVAVKSRAEMQAMASETSSLGGFSKRSLAKSNASRAKPIVVKYLDWFCDNMATSFQNMQVKSRYDVIAVAKKPPPGPVVTRPAITHFLGFQLMTDPSLMVQRMRFETV